jgi:hypothetical protein
MVDRDVLLEILERNDSTAPASTAWTAGDRCLSLRCKGMYLNHGLGETEQVAGDGNFWCGKTQRIYGPDNNLVGDGVCRHTGRACYEQG